MRRKAILLVSIFVILVIVSLYFLLDVKERFEIEALSARVYKIVKEDSLTKCYILNADVHSTIIDTNYLVGIRIQTRWISVKHEGFSALFSSETDPRGHKDTISKISLIDTAQEFTDALRPGAIESFKFPDTTISDHSVNSYNCYITKRMQDVNSLKDWYNQITWKDPAITNMFLFKIDQERLPYLLEHKMTLRFEFQGGKTVECALH